MFLLRFLSLVMVACKSYSNFARELPAAINFNTVLLDYVCNTAVSQVITILVSRQADFGAARKPDRKKN